MFSLDFSEFKVCNQIERFQMQTSIQILMPYPYINTYNIQYIWIHKHFCSVILFMFLVKFQFYSCPVPRQKVYWLLVKTNQLLSLQSPTLTPPISLSFCSA